MSACANIVVVEDERIFALDLKSRLETLGYSVSAMTASGEQAICTVERQQPDLVLMDIHLEGNMDGIEAAQRIQDRFHTPVIFLTAYAEEETLQRARASSNFGYLIKPCTMWDLHATLQMTLARRAAELGRERSEEQLRLALDAANMAAWEWSPADNSLTICQNIDGDPIEFNAEPTTEDCLLRDINTADHESLRNLYDAASQSTDAVRRIYRQLHADGLRSLEICAKAQKSIFKARSLLVGVARDITRQVAINLQLQQSAAVYDSIAEGVFIMNADRRIVSANPAFSSITGYSQEQVVGLLADDLLMARRQDDRFRPHAENLGEDQWVGESYCRRRNGEVFPSWQSVTVVRGEDAKPSHYVVALSDITTIRQTEAQLNFLAHHDPLTGLPNRLLFNDRLEQTLERARREQEMCALIFLDLDGFKIINDTMGHSSGDLLLQNVAARIRTTLRRGDTAARLGGDEFVVILEKVARPEDAAQIARKLLLAIAEPAFLGGESVSVTASVGLSVFPLDGADLSAMVRAADTAMFNAKAAGRNRFCFHTEEMAKRAAERLAIEQGMRRGIERNEFTVFYQPEVELATGCIVGAEALLRWNCPGMGLVPPSRFIHVAEESGLIDVLGRLVLELACAQAAKWQRDELPPLRVSVNVSGRQLMNSDFDRIVVAALAEYGLPPHLLELEITESTLQQFDQDFRQFHALRKLGVSIAVDDFGTGYSSLSVLKHVPIDRIKIDASFVRDIPNDANDVAIVQTILVMARQLGFQVVAEGVETAAQADFLRQCHCQVAQGFHYSRPVDAETMEKLLRNGLAD
jgi:diguanylate cyclase (GGDEF)-like protein/PAS domain S-box-containing protein